MAAMGRQGELRVFCCPVSGWYALGDGEGSMRKRSANLMAEVTGIEPAVSALTGQRMALR